MSIDLTQRQGGERDEGAHRSAIIAPGREWQTATQERIEAWVGALEPNARRFARRYWPELIAGAAVLAVTLYLLRLFTRYPLPPGTDAGQWLTISRYYLGEHVPAGRTISTVPPVIPLALATLTFVLPDRTLAIVALAAICYLALSVVSFLLGRRITGDSAGGLLAVVFVVVAQGDLFDYFSMGAYPQLAGVIGMSVCLLGLLMLSDDETSRRGWLTLAAGAGLTMFSHTPSATVLLPLLACCVGYIAWRSPRRWQVALTAAAVMTPVMIAWCAFLLVNGSAIFGYANVAAAYDLKGPDKLLRNVWADPNERLLYGVAFAAIAVMLLSARDSGLRSARRVVLSVWILALIAVIAASALRHANTDYPRFSAYLVVPVGVAAAAAIHRIARSPAVVGAIAVSVLALAGQQTMHGFNKSAAFYGMNDNGSELTAAGDWLNTSGGPGAVTGGTREVKWLEALTGRDSLLYLPRIYITRPWEVDSAIAAEVIQRASAGVETGRFLATVNDGGQDSGHVFPVGVRVDVYHKGIYSDAFGLNDRDVRIDLTAVGQTQTVELTSATRPVTTTYQDGTTEHLLTRYSLPAQYAQVVRDVSAAGDLPRTLHVDYYIGTLPGVTPSALSASVTRPDESLLPPSLGDSAFDARMFDGASVPVDMTTQWTRLDAPPLGSDAKLVWRKISLQFQINGSERRIDDARIYDEAGVLSTYGVRYLIDRDGDGAAFPIIKDQGLTPVYQNDEYRIYQIAPR